MTDQILQCESGHKWSRPSQRGRPPRVCPNWPACQQQQPWSSKTADPIGDIRKGIQKVAGERQTTIDDMLEGDETHEEVQSGGQSTVSSETNPFILKARQKSEASGSTLPISEAPQGILSADGPFHHPELPGITISEIRRLQAPTRADDEDAIRYVSAPEWTAKVTINGEVYDCKRFGGWEIILDDNRRLALKPSIAFVIQEHIRPLEKAERSRLEKELEAAKIERARKQAKKNRKEPTQVENV